MSPARAPLAERRLVDGTALAALVLLGHALGGGTTGLRGLALLALAVVGVAALARLVPQRSTGADLALLLVAQAGGHLALALGDGGATAHASPARMLGGHALATVLVAALASHGRTSWAGARRTLTRILVRWRVRVAALPAVPASTCRHDDSPRPARVPPRTAAVVRRGPPTAGCTAYA